MEKGECSLWTEQLTDLRTHLKGKRWAYWHQPLLQHLGCLWKVKRAYIFVYFGPWPWKNYFRTVLLKLHWRRSLLLHTGRPLPFIKCTACALGVGFPEWIHRGTPTGGPGGKCSRCLPQESSAVETPGDNDGRLLGWHFKTELRFLCVSLNRWWKETPTLAEYWMWSSLLWLNSVFTRMEYYYFLCIPPWLRSLLTSNSLFSFICFTIPNRNVLHC